MREQDIPHQHGQGVAPLRIERGTVTSLVGPVHDVVMDETRDMDEFEDHRQIHMVRDDAPGGSSGQKSKGRSQALPTAADRILEVVLDAGVHGLGLLADPLFDGVQLGSDQLDGREEGTVRPGVDLTRGPSGNAFHAGILLHAPFIVNEGLT